MSIMSRVSGPLGTRKGGVIIALLLVAVVASVLAYLLVSPDPPLGEIASREITRVEELVDQDPEDPNTRVELAILYYDAGLREQALDQLGTALELDESHHGALTALGDAYMGLERYQEATEPYIKMVELFEDNPFRHISKQLQGVYYQLGVAYSELGRHEEAARSLEEAISIDWTDADTWYVLGETYKQLGQCEESIDSFKQAVRFIPNFLEAYEGLAQCYTETGQPDLAAYAIAMTSYSSGSFGDAARQLEDIVIAVPDLVEAHLGLGLAYQNEGEIEKAIDAYSNALQLDPDLWLAQAKLEALGVR